MSEFVVAITGGIASGKSEVGRRFERLGIVVADADQAARAVVARGQPALAEIVQRFGVDFLLPDGNLDRRRLRALVFSDPQARCDLEAITHPRIRALLKAQCASAQSLYAIAVIPLLSEGGGRQAYPWLQRVLVIDAPLRIRRERLAARDGIGAQLAEDMIRAQAGRERRLVLATDIIINDGAPEALDAPVRRLDALYRKLAQAPR